MRTLLLCLAISPSLLEAQTLFTWPEKTVDVSTYTSIDQCSAVEGRVRHQIHVQQTEAGRFWPDTMPADTNEWRAPWPPVLREMLRKCLGPFSSPDSVSLGDYEPLLSLYLYADWDERAKSLIRRRFAQIPAVADQERVTLVDKTVNTLVPWQPVWVRPPRYAIAEELIVEQARLVRDRGMRLRLLQKPLDFLSRGAAADTALARRVMGRVTALADSLTKLEWEAFADSASMAPEEADSIEHRLAQRLSAVTAGLVGERAMLDTLRNSTAAYARIRREAYERVFGRLADENPELRGLGQKAPLVVADYWDPDSVRQAPLAGRVSIVILLPECVASLSYISRCAGRLIPLARLQKRFPEVDVTAVTGTLGHFRYLKEGMTDSTELALWRRMLDSHGVRARIALSATRYIRVADPDGRRINRPHPNRAYGGTVNLVDADGLLVHADDLSRNTVEDFATRIRILLERSRQGGSAGRK